MSALNAMNRTFKFGQRDISTTEIFHETDVCLSKPYVESLKIELTLDRLDVLIVPKRNVPRYSMLTEKEVVDLTISARLVTDMLREEYVSSGNNGMAWLIQDGKEAGQTVSHVHMHVIPQPFASLLRNGVDADDRPPRSFEEMKREAETFRSKLAKLSKER